MFERFTERARQVVVLAAEEANGHHHAFVKLPHVLVGLMREEGGLAAKVLTHLDYRPPTYEGIATVSGDPEYKAPTSQEVKTAYELALREALSLGHNYIGTEHILLGVIRAGEGTDLGLPENAREEVLRALQGPGVKRTARERLDALKAKVEESEPEPKEPELADLLADLVTVGKEWIGIAKNVYAAVK